MTEAFRRRRREAKKNKDEKEEEEKEWIAGESVYNVNGIVTFCTWKHLHQRNCVLALQFTLCLHSHFTRATDLVLVGFNPTFYCPAGQT